MFSIFEPTCLLLIIIAHHQLNTIGGTINEDSSSEIVEKLQNEIELIKKDNENIKYILNIYNNNLYKTIIEIQKAKLDDFLNDGRMQNENISSLIQRSNQNNVVVIPSELRNNDVHFNCIKNCSPTSRSCDEALTVNNKKEGVYLIKLRHYDIRLKKDYEPFYVYCTYEDKSEQGWMIIQRRLDGSVSFNRTWSDYKLGFGDLDGEYWIGLERLHQITNSKPHELWVVAYNLKEKKYYAKYWEFNVGSENEGYKLTVGGYSGDMGEDIPAKQNSMKFSTFDKDNDGSMENCAVYRGGGWWYNRCFDSDLNGRYSKDGIRIYQDFDIKDKLRKVFMAIRPKYI